MSFGELIRTQRKMRGLTARVLAREAGISTAYLSRIERDLENPPRDEVIQRIADAIGLSVDAVFAAAVRMPPDLRGRAQEMFAVFRAHRSRENECAAGGDRHETHCS